MQCAGRLLRSGCASKEDQVSLPLSPPYSYELSSSNGRYIMTTRTRSRSNQQGKPSPSSSAPVKDNEVMSKPTVSGFINPDSFTKSSIDDNLLTLVTSLNVLHQKFDNVDSDLNKDEEGLVPRFKEVEDNINDVIDENDALRFELDILKGVVHRQETQIESLIGKVNDLTARQMTDNVIISGLLPPSKEE